MKSIGIVLFITILLFGCQLPKEIHSFNILSSDEASSHIILDTVEQYFEKVRPLEMKILLKDTTDQSDRSVLLERYRQFLIDDLMDFTQEEENIVKHVFQKALTKHYNVFPKLKIPEISLIKTKGSYYGPGVYFTRQNDIIIPQDAIQRLLKGDTSSFERVMLHEIFHVLSRNYPTKKNTIYNLLGFSPIASLELSEFLDNRVLFNPDGINLNYVIHLPDSLQNIRPYVPIIYSKHGYYHPRNGAFFNHLVFQLFEISEQGKILSNDIGTDPTKMTSFWDRITRNTSYIIHPDELSADNYVYIIYWKTDKDRSIDRFSQNGQQLLHEIFKTLQIN